MVIAPRAREASVQISLQFDCSRTVDSAAHDVHAAINATAGQLPLAESCAGCGVVHAMRGGQYPGRISNALALAALVAENSPLLGPNEKMVLARLNDGHLNFAFPGVMAERLLAALLAKLLSNPPLA
jgi:hypothetical protein